MRRGCVLALFACIFLSASATPLSEVIRSLHEAKESIVSSDAPLSDKKALLSNLEHIAQDELLLQKTHSRKQKAKLEHAIDMREQVLHTFTAKHPVHAHLAKHTKNAKPEHHVDSIEHVRNTLAKIKSSDKLDSQDLKNLKAFSLDLEMLRGSTDPEENMDLVEAIKLRLPAVQALAHHLKKQEHDSHQVDFDLEAETHAPKQKHVANHKEQQPPPAQVAETPSDVAKGNSDVDVDSTVVAAAAEGDEVKDDEGAAKNSVEAEAEADVDKDVAVAVAVSSEETSNKEPTEQEITIAQNSKQVSLEETAQKVTAKKVVVDAEEQVKSIATASLSKIQQLEAEVRKSSLSSDEQDRFINNLQSLEKDTKALDDPSLNDAQKTDLESAMKLRIAMLQDMEAALAKTK